MAARSNISNALILTTALVTLATSGISAYQSYQNKAEIREVHLTINSRMTELLDVTKELAHARGVIEGEGN